MVFLAFIVAMSFFIACIYSGILIIAGSFSFVMYKSGKFTKSEAINGAFHMTTRATKTPK